VATSNINNELKASAPHKKKTFACDFMNIKIEKKTEMKDGRFQG